MDVEEAVRLAAAAATSTVLALYGISTNGQQAQSSTNAGQQPVPVTPLAMDKSKSSCQEEDEEGMS
eukprot:3365106-Ditylum_brightwellii.AAC.1